MATADNYDRLGYAPDDVTRDARYSRHASPTVMLRSHTSAGIPAVLDSLAAVTDPYDRLHVLPGLVYRRDAVDRTHVGTPVEQLPAAAVVRLEAQPGQVNLLVRLTLQTLDRTLTNAEANALRDRVYLALHEGPVLELTG